jgi:hypothetical protein
MEAPLLKVAYILHNHNIEFQDRALIYAYSSFRPAISYDRHVGFNELKV